VLARSGPDALYKERFHDGGFGWDWPAAADPVKPGRLLMVAVLCNDTTKRRQIVGAVSASGAPLFFGTVETRHWVLTPGYYAYVLNECCEADFRGVDVVRRSDFEHAGLYCDDFCGVWYLTDAGTLCFANEDTYDGSTGVATLTFGANTPTVLDTVVFVDSLALSGTTLSWKRKDGALRSAECT
jgi:hypothetical protein